MKKTISEQAKHHPNTKMKIKINQKKIDRTNIRKKKQHKRKCLQKYDWLHFVLAKYSWVWGLSQGVVRDTTGKKNNFFFSKMYQMQLAF